MSLGSPTVVRPASKNGAGRHEDRQAIAERETHEILEARDEKRKVFINYAYKVFWFDVNRRWADMGCTSLNDWGRHYDVTHPNDLANTVDVFHYFFGADLAVMKKVGQKKMALIVPIANALREEALLFAGAEQYVMSIAFLDAQEKAMAWLQRATEQSWTQLKDESKEAGGSQWSKIVSREDKKDDLLYITVYDEATGTSIRRERTVKELFDLYPELDDVQDETVMRLNLYGPKKQQNKAVEGPSYEESPEPELAGGCPNCGSHRLHRGIGILCMQCGLEWNPSDGEVLSEADGVERR